MSSKETAKPLKTWSHLAEARRRPSEYEIVSTNLVYNLDPASPFELGPNIPMSKWFKKYRHDSPLTGCDWEAFRDPDEMTYRSYNVLQDGQETYIERLLDEHDELAHDQGLSPEWLDTLSAVYTPARYLVHTVQMASHYLVQIVPSSTVRSCVLYQATDQMRWLSQIAYRTAELNKHYPEKGFATAERGIWEDNPIWQGFRELMENVLITYDWGEAFIALNLVAKPAIDETLLRQLAATARRYDDGLLGLLCDSVYRDVQRSRTWTAALVRMAAEREENVTVINDWLEKWLKTADKAIDAYCQGLPESPDASEEARAALRDFLRSLNFEP